MNKGFTLLELLIVIAVMGILSSVVFVGLRSARDKAKDARIRAGLRQVRNLAEANYPDGDYGGLDCSDADGTDGSCSCEDPELEILCQDIGRQGQSLEIYNSGDEYCFCVKLNNQLEEVGTGCIGSPPPSFDTYCVDSSGFSGKTEGCSCSVSWVSCEETTY